jgi:hypothetical protein
VRTVHQFRQTTAGSLCDRATALQRRIPAASSQNVKISSHLKGGCRVCGCSDKRPCRYLEHSRAPIVGQRMIRCRWTDKTETLCTRCRNRATAKRWRASATSRQSKAPAQKSFNFCSTDTPRLRSARLWLHLLHRASPNKGGASSGDMGACSLRILACR